MTISVTDATVTYSGSGSAGPFSVANGGSGIYFGEQSELVLKKTSTTGVETTLALNTDYTVSGTNTSSGTVTLTSVLAVGETLRIERSTPLTQSLSLAQASAFSPTSIMSAFDKLTRIVQDINMRINRDAVTGEFLKLTTAGATDYWDGTGYVLRIADGVGDTDAVTVQQLDAAVLGSTVGNFLTAVTAAATYQPLDASLTAYAALTTAANKGIYYTASDTPATFDLTAAGRALLDDANAAAQLTTLGLTADGQSLVSAANYAAMRALLDLEAGTDFNAYHARLADISGITYAQGDILYYNGSNLVKLAAGTSGDFLKTQGTGANPVWATIPGGGDMLSTNNLSDLASAATARTNLGLSAALLGTNNLSDVSNAATSRTNLGLGTVAVLAETTTAQYLANTADKALSTDQVWAAGALTPLSDGTNIAVDMSLGINFSVTLGGNRTLDNPTNTKVGQSGAFVITQDGTGSRTLSFGSSYEFATGTPFTLSTTASAKDLLFYWVQSSTSIVFTGILKAVA